MKKIIFWAVDCQKDFINKDGALYVEGAETIKPNLKKLTIFAMENKIQVINTRDLHTKGDKELSDNPDFINTFPEHCMDKTEGSEFIDETNPNNYFGKMCSYLKHTIKEPSIFLDDSHIVITKNKFDVFEGNPHTDRYLKLINPTTVIVYGVATNVCVNHAVLGLTKRGIEVLIVEDAIKALPNLPLEEIYYNWQTNKATLINLDEVLEYVEWTLRVNNYKQ